MESKWQLRSVCVCVCVCVFRSEVKHEHSFYQNWRRRKGKGKRMNIILIIYVFFIFLIILFIIYELVWLLSTCISLFFSSLATQQIKLAGILFSYRANLHSVLFPPYFLFPRVQWGYIIAALLFICLLVIFSSSAQHSESSFNLAAHTQTLVGAAESRASGWSESTTFCPDTENESRWSVVVFISLSEQEATIVSRWGFLKAAASRFDD